MHPGYRKFAPLCTRGIRLERGTADGRLKTQFIAPDISVGETGRSFCPAATTRPEREPLFMEPTETNTTETSTPWCEDYWAVSGMRRETCAGCMAREQGRRCWEVSVSPCCKRPRDYCRGCEVYVAYLRSCGASQTVEIHTFDGTTMVGDIYVPAGSRLSTVLNDPDRDFITVTNVSIDRQYSATGGFSRVMMVSRRNITTVEPRSSSAGSTDVGTCSLSTSEITELGPGSAQDSPGQEYRRAS